MGSRNTWEGGGRRKMPPQIIVPWGEMSSRLPPPRTQAWVEQGGVKGHEWFCQRHCLEAPQGPLLPGLHHGWLPDPLHGESMGPALHAALSQRGRTSVKPLDPSPCTESGRFLGTVHFSSTFPCVFPFMPTRDRMQEFRTSPGPPSHGSIQGLPSAKSQGQEKNKQP